MSTPIDSDSFVTMNFVLQSGEFRQAGLRLGSLAIRGRPALATPAYVVPTSRGVIPHVAQDLLSKLTNIPAVYVGFEDFIEKSHTKAPIFSPNNLTHSTRLRDFIALPDDCVAILGPRRVPAVECPSQNATSAIAVSTSVGFQTLKVDSYVQGIKGLEPDIGVGIADVIATKQFSQKRVEKSADRTHAWTRDMVEARSQSGKPSTSLFATVPPLEPQQQSFYLSDLVTEYASAVSGLALHTAETTAYLPESLAGLPRLCLIDPASPHELLQAISLGNDLVTVPSVTHTSEAGVAMTFSFTDSSDEMSTEQPLGFDLWDASNATDLSPLTTSCSCYTCTKHHRAYIHHLLSAKEMLAWTLLQIHNFQTIDTFFSEIRESIADGSFEGKSKAFKQRFSSDMPKASGEGPRIRGYQSKSVGGGEPKKNKKVYGRLDEHARKLAEAESGVATPESDSKAEDLERQGLGQVQ